MTVDDICERMERYCKRMGYGPVTLSIDRKTGEWITKPEDLTNEQWDVIICALLRASRVLDSYPPPDDKGVTPRQSL
jgi:hypothetical protein